MNTDNNERPYLLDFSEALYKMKAGVVMETSLDKIDAEDRIFMTVFRGEIVCCSEYTDDWKGWVRPDYVMTSLILKCLWREFQKKVKKYRYVFGLSNGHAFVSDDYFTVKEVKERAEKYGYVWRVQLFETGKEF